MNITLEISYYPLVDNYNQVVSEFVNELLAYNNIEITPSVMSSLIEGNYHSVLKVLTEVMYPYLEKYPSVFKFTLASACKTCNVNN